MGIYINPTDTEKEVWLENNAVPAELATCYLADFSTTFPVVLVNNGPFTAAAVCDTQQELKRFMQPDGRDKSLYLVQRSRLAPVIEPREMRMLNVL